MPPPRPAAGAPADEPKDFASTVSFDALGLSSPVTDPVGSQGALAGFAPAGLDPSSSAAGAALAAGSFGAAAPAPMIIPGTGPMVAPPPPRRGALLWIALILLLIAAAGATFLFLKMR